MKEMPSAIRLIPGLDVDVIALTPPLDAPATILIAAISLSDWMNTPPSSGSLLAKYSVISF
jgi:hypothetical protein